jgi:transcriptional regulator with XRE-family HTH domain
MNIGQFIQQERKRKQAEKCFGSFTQSTMARKLDCSRTYFAGIECGSQAPTKSMMVKIANELGVDIDLMLVQGGLIPTSWSQTFQDNPKMLEALSPMLNGSGLQPELIETIKILSPSLKEGELYPEFYDIIGCLLRVDKRRTLSELKGYIEDIMGL